ncbi:FAD-dependent oxidoreductase [Roseovarius sp. SCSIO 43702]|uniref:NAD(P)/FAD-dependent oxidoreductase n=1 Tax=Roseovarius sp. SCSIO 43702 TaxID=2823043 RepID=UPI001C73A8C4|nr:FAD-dependent oxidoreductase [Roseovarius sp. SCSIO 43702]QYX56564.1 FAD-dependent oxidoreductase [Roseovarius sp. SCSIO 43702]
MATDAPVTVLGAGIVGICTALSLAERGVPVRLVDRGDPGQETSYGNAGVISPWSVIPQSMPGLWRQVPRLMWGHHRPLGVRLGFWPRMIPWGLRFLANGSEARVREVADAMSVLCAPSVDLYRRHLSGTGHEGLLVDSSYVHAFRESSRATLDALDARIRMEKGARLEIIGADELRRLEPALSPRFEAALLIHGQARALAPGRIATVLTDKARGMGVEVIRSETRALVRSGEGWRITCADGTYDAPRVVVSMGAWSMRLLAPLGLRLPLVAERGYHVEFADPGITLANSVTDTDAKFVASSMEGGLRVAGQAEFGHVDAPPDPRKHARLIRLAQEALPGLDTARPTLWMGRRPSFPDSLPVLGAVPGLPGLHVNFGHSHYGLMMAPKSGEILAEILTGTTPNAPLAPYRADRFDRAARASWTS